MSQNLPDTSTPRGRDQLFAMQEHARDDSDLALAVDDRLKEHAAISGDGRVTCYSCQSWADHRHNRRTGAVLIAAVVE